MFKRRPYARALAATVGVAAMAVALGGSSYSFLAYPGVQTLTQVWTVNDWGQVVGSGFDSNFNFLASFVYDVRSGQFTNLEPIAGFGEFDALGINDAGIIVGTAYPPDYSSESAFILDRSGKYTLFTHPGSQTPGCGTEAHKISNAGLIVGSACTPDGADALGFIYNPSSGKFTDIHVGSFTHPGGINAWGLVDGSADFAADGLYPGSPAGSYSWLRTEEGDITLFSVNGYDTLARGINDLGQIAGFVFIQACGCQKAFVISVEQLIGHGAGMPRFVAVTVPESALFVPTGELEAAGEGINNFGVVVGNTDNFVIGYGFLRTPGH